MMLCACVTSLPPVLALVILYLLMQLCLVAMLTGFCNFWTSPADTRLVSVVAAKVERDRDLYVSDIMPPHHWPHDVELCLRSKGLISPSPRNLVGLLVKALVLML